MPTFAVVSSSMRPRRRSEIARAAAAIAERPSSGYMPECAARPWKRTSHRLRIRGAEDDVADRRRLVVHVPDLRARSVAWSNAAAPSSPTSSFGVKSSSMPACGRFSASTRRVPSSIAATADLLSAPRIVPPAFRTTPSSIDRLHRALGRNRVEMRAEEDRRAAAVPVRLDAAVEVPHVRADLRAGVVLVDGQAEVAEVSR